MCWRTQAGAAWRNQPSWDGGVESHVLREVNRYKERSPRKESGRNSVKESEKNSVHENERMNSVHGLEEMNSEWVILHIWRIVSVKSVRRAWKNYCNFSNIFGIPCCTINILVCCDVQCEKRDLCEDTRHMHPNCQIACWKNCFCLSLLCITRGPLHAAPSHTSSGFE